MAKTSKNSGMVVEEMENELLQTEVSRIDSMVMCSEHALSEIKRQGSIVSFDLKPACSSLPLI